MAMDQLTMELVAAEQRFRLLDDAGTLSLPLPKVLQLADWVWGQFYDGASLQPAERGRLASKLLSHLNKEGDELVTSLALKDFLKWYQTVRAAMIQRQRHDDAENEKVNPKPEGAPSVPNIEDVTPLKTPVHPVHAHQQVLQRAEPLTLVTSIAPASQPKCLEPSASPALKPATPTRPQVISYSNGTPKVLARQDLLGEPMQSSPPLRPMAKQDQAPGGASLATPFRDERVGYTPETYDSIPRAPAEQRTIVAGKSSPLLAAAVAGNNLLEQFDGSDKELNEEKKRVKRLMKIQDRLQQDLEEAKRENNRLDLENNRLDLENKRVLRELEFAITGSVGLDQDQRKMASKVMDMHRQMDELVMQHSEALDSKNAQIIKAVKECQDARDTIELLESKLKNHESLPGDGSGAERDAEMRALQYELASKERRIASLQASLVSLRKIVNKPEKHDEDDKVARLEREKASLESKNIELANALRGMEERFATAIRAAERATGLAEKAEAEKAEMKASAAQTSPAVQRAAQQLQQDGVDDTMMLSKKLRETQRLLLEAYAESDMLRAQVAEASQDQSNKEIALEEKLRQVVAFAYSEREELTKRCSEQENQIRQLRTHLELTHSTHPISTVAVRGGDAPTAAALQQRQTPPTSGNSIQASWLHSAA